MSDFDLVVQGNIVETDHIRFDGWFAVRQGVVVAKGEAGSVPEGKEKINAQGLWVIPGVLDGQVHSGSQANQEGIGMASRAAAAGGITTMVEMPYDDPEPVASRAQLDEKIAKIRAESHVDVATYGTLNDTHGLQAVGGLIEGGVCGFKFSTFEASPNRFPRVEEDILYEAFRLIAPSGLACGVHNQNQELTRKNIERMSAQNDTGWDAFLRAHTPLIENLATAAIYEIGAQTGARAHAVHVSLSRGFEICNMYRQSGAQASIETCVQYLMLNHEEHTKKFGALTKHYPPIRPKAEVEKLWTHIANGDCTFVSSDHVSWGLERKSDPNIFKNASGGPGLETLLPAFWTGCVEHGISPQMVVKQLCEGPAKHFNLYPKKGNLDIGADADFVILAQERYHFDPSLSQSAVTWSSFEGREFVVKVNATFLGGQLVWDGQEIKTKPGSGQFVRPLKTGTGPSK